jgi:hypothetical protein
MGARAFKIDKYQAKTRTRARLSNKMGLKDMFCRSYVSSSDIASYGSNEDGQGFWHWELLFVNKIGAEPFDSKYPSKLPSRVIRFDSRMPSAYQEEEKFKVYEFSIPHDAVIGNDMESTSIPVKDVEFLEGHPVVERLRDAVASLKDNEWLVLSDLAAEYEGCSQNLVLTDQTKWVKFEATVDEFLDAKFTLKYVDASLKYIRKYGSQ